MAKRGYEADDSSYGEDNRAIKLHKVQSASSTVAKLPSEIRLRLPSLPDELLIRILSFLAVEDLINTQSVSRRISRLSKDSQIWKRLYYERFVYRRFGRILKNGSARQSKSDSNHLINESRAALDWKSKYRLSHKWSNGTCNYREIMLASQVLPQTFLCLRGNMAITADSECGLRAWKMRDEKQTFVASIHLQTGDKRNDLRPSALSVEVEEANSKKLNVVVGFASGNIGLYTFDLHRQVFEPRNVFSCFHDQAVSSLAQAGQGYLLAMSNKQAMSLFQINWAERNQDLESPRLVSTLKSQSDWKPMSVTLRATTTVLMASIIYAYPRFLSGWSVGLQELRWNPNTHDLLSTRLATSPQSESSIRTKTIPKVEYLPPTSTKPTSLCYTHPYLLATHPDNTLSLYMVRSTDSELSISPGMRLWGHTSDVFAANIGDRGKAVTVAYGGDVRVWQLEEGLTSALARKATPGPLVSVKLQPSPTKEGLDHAIRRDVLPGSEQEKGEGCLENQGPPIGEISPASIDFDEERLVVLKNSGTNSKALFIYDFT